MAGRAVCQSVDAWSGFTSQNMTMFHIVRKAPRALGASSACGSCQTNPTVVNTPAVHEEQIKRADGKTILAEWIFS